MECVNPVKALFVIVNAGFSDDVMAIARAAGARGATILNARGESVRHETIMGITVDSEKEILLILAENSTSEDIMAAIKEKAGIETPAHSVCFTMPVEKVVGLSVSAPPDEE